LQIAEIRLQIAKSVREGIEMRNGWTICLLSLVAMLAMGMAVTGRAFAQDDEGPTASVRFVVTNDAGDKPVRNAQVVLHPMNRKGKAKGEMELKTDAEGKTSIDGVPYGTVEVQVLAHGFQTYGADYEVKQAAVDIRVKLKRPAGQYSTYGDDKASQK
jgi:Carboxypeptidase regulatory-like domain